MLKDLLARIQVFSGFELLLEKKVLAMWYGFYVASWLFMLATVMVTYYLWICNGVHGWVHSPDITCSFHSYIVFFVFAIRFRAHTQVRWVVPREWNMLDWHTWAYVLSYDISGQAKLSSLIEKTLSFFLILFR